MVVEVVEAEAAREGLQSCRSCSGDRCKHGTGYHDISIRILRDVPCEQNEKRFDQSVHVGVSGFRQHRRPLT